MTELEFKQWIFDPMRIELSPQALLLLLYIKMQNRQRYIFSVETMLRALRLKDVRTLRRLKAELIEKKLIQQKRCRYGFRLTIPALDGADSAFHAPSQNSDSTYNALSENQDSAFYAPSQESDSTSDALSQKSDSTFHAPSEDNAESDSAFHAPSQNSDSAFHASEIVHSVQSDSAFHVPLDSAFHAPLSIYKETNKETNKGDSAKNELEQKSQSDSFSLSTDDNCLRKRKQTYSELEDISEMDKDTQTALREIMKKFS